MDKSPARTSIPPFWGAVWHPVMDKKGMKTCSWLKVKQTCCHCIYFLTPLNTSSLTFSGFFTRPSGSRNTSHLSRGCPLVTSGLGPSSTPLMVRQTQTLTTDSPNIALDTTVCFKLFFFSYTGDEFKAGLFIRLGRQTGILSRTRVDLGIWRSKCRPEEIGDFGEPAKCGGIWVMDKSLFRQKENPTMKMFSTSRKNCNVDRVSVMYVLHYWATGVRLWSVCQRY